MVVEAGFVGRPSEAPLVLVGSDDEGITTVVELVQRLNPPVVVYVDASQDPEHAGVAFHLTWPASWMSVECWVSPDEDVEESPDADGHEVEGDGFDPNEPFGVPAERRAELIGLMQDTADQLLVQDEPKDHQRVNLVRDAIISRLMDEGTISTREAGLLHVEIGRAHV